MNIIHHLFLTLLFLFCGVFTALAEGPVWKISKGDARLFLGGTIHMLSQADYPLPAAFDQAYRQATELVLETDLEKLQSPEFQQRMLKQMLLDDGQTLQDVLLPATCRAVAQYVASRGVPIDQLEKFKPSMLVIMLTTIELQRLGLASTGVDQFFMQRAKNDHKSLGQLESVEEQLAFLTSMGAGQDDAMVMHSLDELDQLPELIQSLKAAWRRGDNDVIVKSALAPWKEEYPAVYNALLVKRNRAWLPQIETLLKTPEVEFVLVGALHLVGEDGILQDLAAHGYTVEQL